MEWIAVSVYVAWILTGGGVSGQANDSETLLQDKFPEGFFADKNTTRPYLAFARIPGANLTSMASDDAPALACGGSATLTPGVNLCLETPNYPGNMNRWSSCRWNLQVRAGTFVTLLCEVVDVPCLNSNSATLAFYFSNRGRKRFCTTGSEGTSQRFEFIYYPDDTYNAAIIVRSRASSSARVGCTLRSMGGGGPPPPPSPPSPTPSPPSPTPSPPSPTPSPPSPTPPPPSPSECGTSVVNRGVKIVGGGFATEKEYPFMAWFRSAGGACGSTVVNLRSLLTAAHCVEGISSGSVYPGCHDIRTCGGTSVRVHAIFPGYRFPTNDIAVLRFNSPLSRFTESIRPVCLPAPGSARLPVNRVGTIAGWGRFNPNSNSISAILKEGRERIISCPFNAPTSICTREDFGTICNGDSGGFFGVRVNNRWTQYGITSFGTTSNCVNGIQGFADITGSRASWISNNI